MYCLFLLLLLQTILSCHCQLSFTITRSESGDEVAPSLTSADYCSAIHGYLDGSQCKCDYRYTFSLEHQVCIDYYNVPRFRFSRQGLNADVSVSVVNIAVGETDGAEPTLEFAASSTPLPVVEGTAHRALPAGCNISSLEFNTFSGWVTNNFTGFSLATHNSALYLEVTELPNEGVELFQAQFVRLTITCPDIADSLMFKFGGTQTFNNDVCEPNPCLNSGVCITTGDSFVCNCTDGFAGEFCEIPTDRCEDDDDDDDDECDTRKRTCSSFSVVRMDDGDMVNTPLSSVEYCSSIRAYCPDGSCSYCQCDFRLTYRHDLQRCDDYYNECPLRFSRLGLSVDTGVSTVGFVEDDQGIEINFEATPSQLPIVQGPADVALPSECIVSSLAVNRAAGWVTVNHGGFSLRQNHSDTFLQIDERPSLGITFFNSELVRLNITCQGTSYGCLPMKFNGDPKNYTYSIDLCCPNPCNNNGSCIPAGNSFTCSCPPNYSGPLCDDFDDCSTEPCMNGGTCTDGIDSYTCTCPTGFTGDNCDNNGCPCMNGGNCTEAEFATDGVFGGFCVCPERFTGDRCELCIFAYTGINCDEDVDECSNEDPCAYGNCTNTIGSFVCDCEDGYTGEYCSEAVCADPCLNGGICLEPDVCQCSGQYGGLHCEISNGTISNGIINNNGTINNGAISDSVSQDEASQTGTAVGVSVGLVVALVATIGVIILAMIVYTKYHSRKRRSDTEQDSDMLSPMLNPTYDFQSASSNSDSIIASEEVVYTVPDNQDEL